MNVCRTDRWARSATAAAVLALLALVAVSCGDDSRAESEPGGSSPEEATERAAEALYSGDIEGALDHVLPSIVEQIDVAAFSSCVAGHVGDLGARGFELDDVNVFVAREFGDTTFVGVTTEFVREGELAESDLDVIELPRTLRLRESEGQWFIIGPEFEEAEWGCLQQAGAVIPE